MKYYKIYGGKQTWYTIYDYFNVKILQYDAIHDFSVLLRTGSNPADVNRFGSITEKYNTQFFLSKILERHNVLHKNNLINSNRNVI